ncbi:MAG: RND transporter, partial [Spirochaetales bacterium]|nr:RND transporter [Spirochaetales bacterium]
GVDDAIHFMHRFKNNKGDDFIKSIRLTIIETGRPIILSTVSIVAGMMMLSFGSFMPIRYFGLLMSISLFGCMISTLIFMPPVMILFDKIKKLVKK